MKKTAFDNFLGNPSSAVIKVKEFLLEDFGKLVDIHLIENIRGGNNL